MSQLVHMCRLHAGKSHGFLSAWCVGHHPYVFAPGGKVPVVFVRNAELAAQLKLMFT